MMGRQVEDIRNSRGKEVPRHNCEQNCTHRIAKKDLSGNRPNEPSQISWMSHATAHNIGQHFQRLVQVREYTYNYKKTMKLS